VHINARAILNVIANILTEMNIAADCVALFRIEAGEIAATIAIRRILLRALCRAFCMARMRSSTLHQSGKRDRVSSEVKVFFGTIRSRYNIVVEVLNPGDRFVRVLLVLGGPVEEERPRVEAGPSVVAGKRDGL
jgi:hypothetical protein